MFQSFVGWCGEEGEGGWAGTEIIEQVDVHARQRELGQHLQEDNTRHYPQVFLIF